jgi:hypothetical protein
MYFLNAQPLYSDRVIAALSAALEKRAGVTDYAAILDPTQEQKDVHIDLTLSRLDDGWQAVIDLFDRGEKIATFTQTGIPGRALAVRLDVGRDRMTVSFFSNALDIFLHSNLGVLRLTPSCRTTFRNASLRHSFGRPAADRDWLRHKSRTSLRASKEGRKTRLWLNPDYDRPLRLVARVAEMLPTVHADRLAGHGDGAFHEKQRCDRNILRPDAALERILGLRRRQPLLVLLLGEDLARPGAQHAARAECIDPHLGRERACRREREIIDRGL